MRIEKREARPRMPTRDEGKLAGRSYDFGCTAPRFKASAWMIERCSLAGRAAHDTAMGRCMSPMRCTQMSVSTPEIRAGVAGVPRHTFPSLVHRALLTIYGPLALSLVLPVAC